MANNNPCASTALYESLVHCKGTTVLPGLRPHIFYIAKSDIVTFPAPPNTVPSGGSMGALATISENFVLKADAKWKRIDIIALAVHIRLESKRIEKALESREPVQRRSALVPRHQRCDIRKP